MLKEQIEYAECDVGQRMTTDSVKGSSPYFPWTKHSIRIHGVDIAGYENEVKRLKNRLQKRVNILTETVKKASDYISSIEDSEIRMVLHARYILGQTWEEIEDSLGINKRTGQRIMRKWYENKKYLKCP